MADRLLTLGEIYDPNSQVAGTMNMLKAMEIRQQLDDAEMRNRIAYHSQALKSKQEQEDDQRNKDLMATLGYQEPQGPQRPQTPQSFQPGTDLRGFLPPDPQHAQKVSISNTYMNALKRGDLETAGMMITSGESIGMKFPPQAKAALLKQQAPERLSEEQLVAGKIEEGLAAKGVNRKATKTEIVNEMHRMKLEEQEAAGKSRFGNLPTGQDVRDTKTGEFVPMSRNDYTEANKKEPGRFVLRGTTDKYEPMINRRNDIYFNVDNVNKALAKIPSFSAKLRTVLKGAERSTDPEYVHGYLSNIINGKIGEELSGPELDYLVAVNSLSENALALTKIGGFGTSAADIRDAIRKVIPSTGTFSKEMAEKQTKLFKGTVERLTRGYPKWKYLDSPDTTGTQKAERNVPAPGTTIRYDAQGNRL